MNSLKWENAPHHAAGSASKSAGPAGNPWFAVSMGLSGLVAGFVIGTFTNNPPLTNARPPVPSPAAQGQVAQAPVIAEPPAPPATPAKPDDDPALGDRDAPVTLIEFTDYQCPFCGRHFTDTYGQIKKDYVDTGKVKYVVRDFPLNFHPHAQKTAEATECADDQGKFWEMHDKVFQTQQAWSGGADIVPTLKQYAADLQLDAAAFNTCLDSGKYKDEVQNDMADGTASGVNGTPGFWLLGPDGKSQQISGAQPYSNFKQAFDAMLP